MRFTLAAGNIAHRGGNRNGWNNDATVTDAWRTILDSGNYHTYLPFLNSTSTHASKSSVIYAPTSAGTTGQILMSNDSGAPSWTSNINASNINASNINATNITATGLITANNVSATGQVVIRTDSGDRNKGFYITRSTTAISDASSEYVQHYVTDLVYYIVYKNDEDMSRIQFNFKNTDTESDTASHGTGASASDNTIEFRSDKDGTKITADIFNGTATRATTLSTKPELIFTNASSSNNATLKVKISDKISEPITISTVPWAVRATAAVNLESNKISISDSSITIKSPTANNSKIKIGYTSDGTPTLGFYDNNGDLLYDLGPSGLLGIEVKECRFIPVYYLRTGNLFETGNDKVYGNFRVSSISADYTYYKYQSKSVGGIKQYPEYDGQVYTSTNMQNNRPTGNLIDPGRYQPCDVDGYPVYSSQLGKYYCSRHEYVNILGSSVKLNFSSQIITSTTLTTSKPTITPSGNVTSLPGDLEIFDDRNAPAIP